MTSFAGLPTELKEAIFAKLPKRDLLASARTSKSLRAAALSALYRDISFTFGRDEKLHAPIVALLRRLLDDPMLISHVRGLELLCRDTEGRSDTEDSNDVRMSLLALKQEDFALLKQVRETSEEFNGVFDPYEEDLAIAIALLIRLCGHKLESLTLEIPLLIRYRLLKILLSSSSFLHSYQSQEGQQFSRLKHVTLKCSSGGHNTAASNELEAAYDIFRRLLELPTLSTLELTYFPDLDSQRTNENAYANATSLHPEQESRLDTVRLKQSLALPGTLGFLLKDCPNLTTFEYHCHLPSSKTPLDCTLLSKALHPFRDTLKHLIVRCEIFADEAVEIRSLGTICKGRLGPLREFKELASLDTSLALLYGQADGPCSPLLADLLPPQLQHLTINDDLWGFEAFTWEGLEIAEILRTYLTGEAKEEANWIDEEERWEVTWARIGGPGWRIATPELKEFLFDMQRRRWEFYDFWGEPTHSVALKEAVEAQGLRCSILGNG